jgi:hypothetical protein
MHFPRGLAAAALALLLCGALVGDDPKPVVPQAPDLLPPLFRKQLSGVKVFKVGDEAEKAAYILGKTGEGRLA